LNTPQHILVIRFSAMGDVAMTVPVIKNVLQQNPHITITVVSNAFLQPLFSNIDRCNFHPAYLQQKHKGIVGLYRLFKELQRVHKFTAVADLHGVLRASILKFFFKFTNASIATIDKGREEKKLLTQIENKVLQPLATSFERYALVFTSLGFKCNLAVADGFGKKIALPNGAVEFFKDGKITIGLAPFAQHAEKMYPLDKMKIVVTHLAKQGYIILLLGGGKNETHTLQNWSNKMPGNVINLAGTFSLQDELAIISNLQAMVSMDSANMHLASLYNVPVISIWGATHPYAGFYGWGQPLNNIVSDNIGCRPCSIFGNKACYRGDHACMNNINPLSIVEKITQIAPIH
jgi:ADP-heptose:LPS heptosyltransferase